MRGFKLPQTCLAFASLFIVLLVPTRFVAAEGSLELDAGDTVTGGIAHDQEVNVATQMYVDVLNPSGGTEKICWRGSGDLTVYRPNGTSLVTLPSSNMNGCTSALATTGSYRVALSQSQTSGTRWDIRVCASTVSNTDCRSTTLSNHRNGRLWSTEWSFQSNTDYAASRSNNGSVFAVVPGGDVGRDAVIEMQMRGVSGAFYRLFANSTGPQTSPGNVRVGRSVPKTNHTVVPLYRLYLNPPESALYNWLTPVVSSVVQTSTCSDAIVLDSVPGSVTFNSNVTGQYVLICDVNDDGQYDLASDNDFSSFGDAAMNSNTVSWNGKTNGGANAAAGIYDCVVRLNVGEFHYMADDIETSHPGIRMYRVESDKTTKTAVKMFWDDTDVAADAEAMNNVAGVLSPSFPVPAGLDPDTYATASSPFYYVGGDTSSPTGNARAWGNFDGDGKGNENYLDMFAAAATMQSPAFQVAVVTASGDFDNDGLTSTQECTLGTDPADEDTDGDGVEDGDDDEPLLPTECADSDMDGCDDCALGPSNPANDGPDVDANGICDNGDADNDTVTNINDVAPFNPLRCRDVDADSCDDCSAGMGPNLGNDGADKDADTLCDKGDVDSDNDGISDTVELGGTDQSLDTDNDGVPNYQDPNSVTCLDLLPLNGICDVVPTALDADGDQIPNHLDRDSDRDGLTDAREAGGTDANGDGVPDSCLPVTATGACSGGLVASPPNTDSPGDAIANYLDTDSDGDSISDFDEAFDANNNQVADFTRSGVDTDQDGIDNSFDTNCIPATNCGGTLGQPVTSPLSTARDANGDGIGDWLQVCGDAYVTGTEPCDDGNAVNTDACSNTCLRGTTVTCLTNAQCSSNLCDLGTFTCQTCTNNSSGGTDTGCSAMAPNCRTNAGVNSCFECADTAAGTSTDEGCTAGSPMCNTSGNGGLGACVACLADANCNDSNTCTTDTCSSGTCNFATRTAGTSCTGGVCNGSVATPMCVACVDSAGVGGTDAGCSGSTKACKTAGAGAPVCVACVADGDCASGVCGANNTCVTCENNQAGAATDHGCGGGAALCNASANGGLGACVSCFDDQSGDTTDVGCGGATPVCNGTTNTCATCLDAVGNDDIGCSGATMMCNTSGNGGLGACAACLNASHCSDGNSCTTDTCTAGACTNPPSTVGTTCSGGVCNGTTPAMCITCADTAGAGGTDAGCGGSTKACKTTGTGAPLCVACVADGDCASGVCGANNTCVTCEDNQTGTTTDHGCGGGATLCNASANAGAGACVACLDSQTGDTTDLGCGGSTPVCNPTSNVCRTCLDAPGNDDLGCSGSTALCNTSSNGGLGACVACLSGSDCGDSNTCTTDTCTAGACTNPPVTAGTTCSGGVCNGTTPAMCITCVDNAGVGGTDSGCGGATKACKTTGAGAPLCVACVADGDCASGVCGANNTCVTCEDNQTGATADHGCSGGTLLCNAAANGGLGACVSCFDNQTGDTTDVGCGGSTPVCNGTTSTCATCLDAVGNDDTGCSGATTLCNTSSNGGLGACVACLSGADCSDSNTCTTDTCTAGACSNPPASAGTTCSGGVCDGTVAAMCVTCVDNAGVGLTDSGCSGSTKACKTTGAGAPVCVACVADGDCASGVCGANNTCVTCEDNQPGTAADHGCSGMTALCNAAANSGAGACVACLDSQVGDATDLGCGGATPVCNGASNTCATCLDDVGSDDIGCSGATELCNTSGNGGLGACVGCLGDSDCSDSNTCTSDTCTAGACSNPPVSAGTACAGGVCDGTVAAMCVTCVDNAAVGLTDSGCSGTTKACDTSGAAPVCVACVVDGDCASGVCGASNTCVTCEDDQVGAAADHGCGGMTALCNAAANGGAGACVGCFDDQAGDATDLGCGGATPVCNPSSSTCATCFDVAGDDDIGCSGATTMCNASGNGGLGVCAGCLNDGQCDDDNACTTDTCQTGVCEHDSLAAGSMCTGGVCDGAASDPECVTCLDDVPSDSIDSGCDADVPLCNEAGATLECVECLMLTDCPMGMYCSADNECVAGCADDGDCVSFPETPRCELTDGICVECLTSVDCQGTELCDINSECSQPDSDDDGVNDDIDLDDDNDGVTDDLELGGEDLSLDSDDDGVPDYRDADDVTCVDASPADGVCDETAEEVDADGDGIPNHLDLDSDGDGITDARESADNDDDGDGMPDDCLPVDADGLCQSGSQEPTSTDEDGTPDFLDLDSDGDGLLDLDEAFDSDGDGVSNIEPAGVDTDENGIDDAFDPSCEVGVCDGVIGQPVLGTLAPSQDWDGNDVPNWLQTCGDSYPTDGEACDDGNGVDGDACSNSCLRGLGEGCDDDDECGSMLCDPELETCQGCVDDDSSGTDSGCALGAPTCVTVSGENTCVVCADDQTGLAIDDGCSNDAALCDETAAGGLGACIECFSVGDCDDDNDCTIESCSAGACGSSGAAAGSACEGGVCDGEAAGECVACVDDEGEGATDTGCSSDTPACDTSGASPVCTECVANADCGEGLCDDGTCVECIENEDCDDGYCNSSGACVPGCSADDDCAGEEGTTRCDTDSAECVACTSDEHCAGEQLCTAGNECSFDDNDGDGLPDDVDTDDDNDGITDRDELGEDLSADEDDDGVLDFHDPDFVTCTASENASVCATLPEALDVDGDDIPNPLDDDSDADGVPDATEGHDADFDGVPDRTPENADSDGDGLDDAFDGDCSTASACDGVIGVVAPRPDADDDDKPNFLDADDDGDGRDTADERTDADDYDGPADDASDIDGDGPLNWYDTDSDGDGALDVTENMDGGDANDDGLLDYLDPSFRATDTDGDGVLDVVECPAPAHPDNNDCPDTDGDGKPDYDDTDDDNDGVLTADELNPPQGRDVDDDGKPNYLDTDDDNDGVLTKDELGEDGRVLDTDGDGTSNPLDTDDDNDGIPTERERGEDGNVMDTDDDGRPNHLDTDDDNDTIPTRQEIDDDGSFLDTDDDDIPNHLDPDDDDDGIPTADEPGDENNNDVPDYLEKPDPKKVGTLAGGALCAVSHAGSGGGTGGLTTGLLLGFGLMLAMRLRARKKKLRDLSRAALAAALLFALSALSGSTASAQVAVDEFKPAPLASDGFALSRPDVLQPGAWGLVLMLDYANDPLVYELTPDDEDSEVRVISNHLVGHVGAAVGIFDRLTIFGMLPIHLVMSGEDSPLALAPEPEGAGIGDLAFGGRFLLLGTGSSKAALALEFIERVPTAELANGDQAYSGDTIGSYEPALVGEVRAGRFDVRLRAGARLREPRTVGNLRLDQELLYGVGARYRVIEALYAHAEVYGSTFMENAFAREQTPLEALFGGKYQPSDFHFGLAAGPGILRGYGSPDLRIVASIGYAPVEKHEEPVDTDGDGLYDNVDACPRDPEDKDQFEDQDGCPDPDNDKDGIVDVQDQCVNDPEDADEFEDENGCPDPDNDKDGILDAQDKCINDPEDTDAFEDEDGCVDPDNDKDGLLDADDSCPNEPEDLDGFEDDNGCPEEGSGKVKVTCDKIDLQDRVFFDTNSDRIQERSFELLDQVVAVLKAAKHIKKMRIEGHTDDRGNDAKNLDLSKRRAASVVRYLVDHGVVEDRLESEGYGESRPLTTNKTSEGRGENRRVEFVIVEQDSSCSK